MLGKKFIHPGVSISIFVCLYYVCKCECVILGLWVRACVYAYVPVRF